MEDSSNCNNAFVNNSSTTRPTTTTRRSRVPYGPEQLPRIAAQALCARPGPMHGVTPVASTTTTGSAHMTMMMMMMNTAHKTQPQSTEANLDTVVLLRSYCTIEGCCALVRTIGRTMAGQV